MSRMWEIDPETRTKLLAISKTNGNDKCCDCGAPSPQWASPKFGTFICLNCAGTHRGLGVHISFVRSITMDAFKTAEIQRMEQGGNEPWKSFYDNHPVTLSEGRSFEDSTIKERYDGDVGEEWKERLSAKVDGREYVPGQKPKKVEPAAAAPTSRSSTPLTGRGSPAVQDGSLLDGATNNNKDRNEAYFAKLGAENASRPAHLPPSQGGKYAGFGGGLPPSAAGRGQSSGGGVPGLDDFQKDPITALTKGFGWFTSTVGKGAKTVHDSYIQPTAKSIAESDFAAQARIQAAHLGSNLQAGARGAADQFNRFVEGDDQVRRRAEPERKDFWDDFASLAAQPEHRRSGSGAIGTAAMKGPPSSGFRSTTSTATTTTTTNTTTPGASSGITATSSSMPAKGKDDSGGWDDNW